MNSPFRGLKRSGNQSYPYPRTHTPVMVFRNNTRSVVVQNSPDSSPNSLSRISFLSNDDIKKSYVPKRRPPLNWAIPTIPESLSDESIKSILSQKNDDMGNFIIDKDSRHVNFSKLIELKMIDKNFVNNDSNDTRQCELNEIDKKNNNFVDKFKIRKYWKKHQKNKSFEEKGEKNKGNTQIPRLKMKNILKMNVKEKNNLEKHDIPVDDSEKLKCQKINIMPTNSNTIRGKSPLITMAQKFRLRNGKTKGFKENSSTNVNGSTSMDFMKSILPTNLNQYTESLKRSQSLEAKTGQINEIYTNDNQQEQKNDISKNVEENCNNDDYLYIYSAEEEECKKIKKEDVEDDKILVEQKKVPLEMDEKISDNNKVNGSEKCERNDSKIINQNGVSCEKINECQKNSQTSTQKQNNKITFKSFFNSKILKSGKTKSLDEKGVEENDPSNTFNVSDDKMISLAELESKLYLQNPLNRPLVVPNNFGKCFNDDCDIYTSDDKLLRCTETYAPISYQIQKALGKGDKNDDDLCPLRIPKDGFVQEKLPLILKEMYCKPFIQNDDDPPENIQKCKEFDNYCIETFKKQVLQHILVEKSIKEREEILSEAIDAIENDEYLVDSLKDMLMSHFNDKINDLDLMENENICKECANKDEEIDKMKDKMVFDDEMLKQCSNNSKDELHKNISDNINDSLRQDSDAKLSNDAISFASINLLTSSSSDIVIETSPEEFENLQNDLNQKLSPQPSIVNEEKNESADGIMILESTVIDNISPPKFIKSTYIPMIEDSIDDDYDVIEDKICKSGDGFKLDIPISSNKLQINNVESRKVDTPKFLTNLSPYDNVTIEKKNLPTTVKLKSSGTLRKPGKQFFTFFSKGRKKHKKTMETLSEDKVRKAPLAQSECTRIANSPMIETPPISLFQKNSKTITDDVISGVPAVVNEEEYLTPKTPRSRANVDSSAGLIDDELNDQPMLIGNSYSMNNLGSLTSFQIDHFEMEEEYQGDMMSQSISVIPCNNNNNNNDLCVIRNKGMAKSITDALIANNLKDDLTPDALLLPNDNINTISGESNTLQSISRCNNKTDDEKSDNSFNSSKENQIVNKNNNEEHILKCTENGETKIDIKLLEFENQSPDLSIFNCQQNVPLLGKGYETTNSFSIIKQLKQENKKLQDVIKKKDDEIRLLKEKLSIFINL